MVAGAGYNFAPLLRWLEELLHAEPAMLCYAAHDANTPIIAFQKILHGQIDNVGAGARRGCCRLHSAAFAKSLTFLYANPQSDRFLLATKLSRHNCQSLHC